jgi:hypothetical protein
MSRPQIFFWLLIVHLPLPTSYLQDLFG